MKTKYSDNITDSITASLKDIKAAAEYFTVKGYDDEADSLKKKHALLKRILKTYVKAQNFNN